MNPLRNVRSIMNGIKSQTPTALRRWSTQNNTLPPVSQIHSIHIYDFDNTLFSSPLPSKHIWSLPTFGQLQAQDFLRDGGWWHNPRILAAVGEGIEIEEPRAWESCWNETIVELVRLSMQDESVLTVLLTGRSETGFEDLIGRMVRSKGLTFNMCCLKPKVGPSGETYGSTMMFKQALLKDIVFTYTNAEEIRIYEDRPKHTKAFRDFFEDLNKALLSRSNAGEAYPQRQPVTAEVIQVSEQEARMDPVVEVAEVQRMINIHNQHVLSSPPSAGLIPYKIKRSVFYTGYILSNPDIETVKSLVQLPQNIPEHEIKFLANNVLIVPRPAPPSILSKIGGIGAKQKWHITGIAVFEQRLWAARVAPIPSSSRIYTENPSPCIVLATRRQTKPIEVSRIQNWQPVPPEWENWEFETTVGEKAILRIEEERRGEDEWESSFPNQANASAGRKHPREDEWPSLPNKSQPRPQQRSTGSAAWSNKPGGIGFASQRGGSNFSGMRGMQRGTGHSAGSRGRGGRGGGGMQRGRGKGGYRSLDDNVGQGYGGGSMQY